MDRDLQKKAKEMFYSERNQQALQKSVEQAKQGKFVVKSLEELEEMEYPQDSGF